MNPLNRTDFISHLRALDACDEALAWIAQTPGEPADLWTACQRGDWMIWLLVAVGYDERTMRHIACDCAAGVLPIYERAHPDDRRPHDCIAVERRHADGAATDDELRAARVASWAAAREAALVASLAAASDAASAAAWAAAGAAADAAAGAAAWGTAGEAASQAAWSAALAAASEIARAESWGSAGDAACEAARVTSLAAAWGADNAAAYAAARARHADMVRARVSWWDVERALAAVGAQEGGGAREEGRL